MNKKKDPSLDDIICRGKWFYIWNFYFTKYNILENIQRCDSYEILKS